MTTLATLNIPQVALQPNAPGSRVSPRIPAAATSMFITMQQINWPFAGGQGLFVSMLLSLDDGQTFTNLQTFDVDDVHQGGETLKDGTVVPIDTFIASVPLGGVGNPQRRLQVLYTAKKPITIAGSAEARG
jgi:hypothetical protein